MEIKLKENSNLIIKNHNGNTLCSVDEATGTIVGGGTKLYKHTLTNSQSLQITIISFDSTPLTGWPSPYNKFEYLYARLGDYKKIIAFYVDDSEYVEKAYYVNDFDLVIANNMYGTFTLGTFVGDTVTPL